MCFLALRRVEGNARLTPPPPPPPGDEEQSLGLPISPYMDRTNPQLSKLQESFINHLVAPLCNAYGEAGLMPGVWQDSCEDDEAEPNLKLDEFNDEDEDDPPTSESDTATQNSGRTRKIFCLQTQHLQENHQHWVNKIKVRRGACVGARLAVQGALVGIVRGGCEG